MNNYIDTNNNIWGLDSTQTALIPFGSVLIPSIYNQDQYPYLSNVNGVINFNSSAYNNAVTAQKTLACKVQAKSLLAETDWTEIPSVTNRSNNPHLINAADFITYRNTLRALAVNPVANTTLPTKPTEQWSS